MRDKIKKAKDKVTGFIKEHKEAAISLVVGAVLGIVGTLLGRSKKEEDDLDFNFNWDSESSNVDEDIFTRLAPALEDAIANPEVKTYYDEASYDMGYGQKNVVINMNTKMFE